MTNGEAVKWIINISADIGKAEHRDLWHYEQALYEIREMLESVQTDIIRCKDCKHSEHWYRDKSRCFLWHEEGIDVFEDGFCNYAERRADG